VLNFHLADAVLGPEIARRTAWASRHALDATINDQLLSVALAYLDLLEAHQRLAIARGTQTNIDELVRITAKFAESGQGLRADANRAETESALRRNEVLQAEEAVAVASARLAELLRMDPSIPLQPCEPTVVPLQLADASADSRTLVSAALSHRPELREQRALVDAACQRLQREKYAPLVPSVLLGASYTGFGGGIGSDVNNFSDRADFDALAYWQVRGLGFGERAARAEATARVDQARFRQLQTMDRVAREVVEAKAQVDARARQIAVAEDAVRAAESSYRLNSRRISELQGLPIETLQAIQALDAAQREYLRAITDFNEAQFRLHRALGWPIAA
jgi:outer membrane protein TolC